MVSFFPSPKSPASFLIEDVLPDMDCKSEMLNEEHLRKVRFFVWLFAFVSSLHLCLFSFLCYVYYTLSSQRCSPFREVSLKKTAIFFGQLQFPNQSHPCEDIWWCDSFQIQTCRRYRVLLKKLSLFWHCSFKLPSWTAHFPRGPLGIAGR